MKRNALPAGHFAAMITIGGSLMIILFLAFSWGNALFKEARLNAQIESFEKENTHIATENEKLRSDFLYFSSPRYRDKWAKEHEGVALPNEKVIVIEFAPEGITEDLQKNRDLLEREILLSRPNREQWKIFFFGE